VKIFLAGCHNPKLEGLHTHRLLSFADPRGVERVIRSHQVAAAITKKNLNAQAPAPQAPIVLSERKIPVTLQGWADFINDQHRQTVASIVKLGEVLIAAQQAAGPGQWVRLFHKHPDAVERPIRFSLNTAEQLMKIAHHPVLRDSACMQTLPAKVGALVELSRMSHQSVLAALDAGRITPDMTRDDAARIRAIYEPSKPVTEAEIAKYQKALTASPRARLQHHESQAVARARALEQQHGLLPQRDIPGAFGKHRHPYMLRFDKAVRSILKQKRFPQDEAAYIQRLCQAVCKHLASWATQ
jgi:hypothetical protein